MSYEEWAKALQSLVSLVFLKLKKGSNPGLHLLNAQASGFWVQSPVTDKNIL